MKRMLKDLAHVFPVLGTLLALLTAPVMAQAKRPSARFEPPDGKCMVFIGAAWGKEIQTYHRLTGDTPAGTKFFSDAKDTNSTFFWQCARNNCPPDGTLLIEYGLAQTTQGDLKPFLKGEFDQAVRNLGNAIKEWGGPVYMVIGYEFDHPDERWKKRYTAREFVQVHRRIHDAWDKLGVTNVAFVWHTSNESPEVYMKNFGRADLARTADFWPGDRYVDWVGASVYWDDQARHLPLVAAFARRKGKPLMICESSFASNDGSMAVARDFEQWHRPFLRLCEANGVKAIGYNNIPDEPLSAPQFRRSSFDFQPEGVVRGWAREMGRPRYLHASSDLHRILGLDVRGGGDAVAGVGSPSTSKTGAPLLNEKDLTGWSAYFKGGDAQAEDEFVVSSQGVLALKGRHEGYLRTDEPHKDFLLTFDWRFPRGGKMTGSGSGVLLRLGDQDGWLSQGFEIQIAEGNCGDLWVYDGTSFAGQRSEGRFGRLPKRAGAERPIGDWNTYEIRCEGSRVTVKLNGRLVTQATSDRPIAGRIGLISQGTDVEFRDLRLTPVRK